MKRARVTLLPLPCGCVAELGALVTARGHLAAGCPWCSAVFSASDLRAWHAGGCSSIVAIEGGPRPLIRFGLTVLEHVGHCGCGAPMVRECGGVVFHLAVPVEMVVELRN